METVLTLLHVSAAKKCQKTCLYCTKINLWKLINTPLISHHPRPLNHDYNPIKKLFRCFIPMTKDRLYQIFMNERFLSFIQTNLTLNSPIFPFDPQKAPFHRTDLHGLLTVFIFLIKKIWSVFTKFLSTDHFHFLFGIICTCIRSWSSKIKHKLPRLGSHL